MTELRAEMTRVFPKDLVECKLEAASARKKLQRAVVSDICCVATQAWSMAEIGMLRQLEEIVYLAGP